MERLEQRRLLSGEGDLILDFGDAPEGPGGPFYPTLLLGVTGNGAWHRLNTSGPQLGPTIDAEPDGQPHLAALGDDLNTVFSGIDDEDGVRIGLGTMEQFIFTPGTVVMLQVENTGGPGFLNTWFDWDSSGDWTVLEHMSIDFPLGPGLNLVPLGIPNSVVAGQLIYSRFRVNTVGGLGPGGGALDGEVEDYRNIVGGVTQSLDFGDAPDSAAGPFFYPTLLAGASGDPARHQIVVGGPALGAQIDAEADGQPSLPSDGDDLAGVDDEDGVTSGGTPIDAFSFIPGTMALLEITTSGASGFVDAWFDWNRDGNWGAGEQVATNFATLPGVNFLPLAIPAGLTQGAVYSRFRISAAGGLTPQSLAPDGEVEDYRVRIVPDTVPPNVVAGTLEYDTRQAVTISFTEPLDASTVDPGDLVALNLDDGTMPPALAVIVAPGNTAATWVFNTPGTFVTDGDYDFTLPAGSVTDLVGNPLAAAFTFGGPGFFYLAGDADRDRDVDSDDFNLLATNFGLSGKPFSLGNFDYDAAGKVDSNDFNILATRFGISLASFARVAISPNSMQRNDRDSGEDLLAALMR